MHKKRILALLLAALMVFALVGCASTATQAPATTTAPAATTAAAASKAPAATTAVASSEAPVSTPSEGVLRLSTTTSVNDSGLLPYLQPTFEADTGIKLEVTSAGTGAAIKKGETGDADCLLVHAKASEEAFISAGYGVERIPFMYNYFVICGPADDPAGVKSAKSASEAFAAIADKNCEFVSRGDDSGTNKAELKIWEAAEITPEGQAWYISAGAGMGACLTQASERGAYVLTDKATYLSMKDNLDLEILLEQSDELMNTYSMIAVSADKWPDTNIEAANKFIEWMTSDKASELINNYGVQEYGEQLFYVIEK